MLWDFIQLSTFTNTFFQSHTGATMAKAFQRMLEQFGLTQKILAFNADNATANDKQTVKLDALDNSFEEANRARCFNHTLQLSAKTLLAPFNTAISGKAKDDGLPEGDDNDNDNDQLLLELEEEVDDAEEGVGDIDMDDEDDGINELQELSENEREQVLEDTTVVRETVTKVCTLPWSKRCSYTLLTASRFANKQVWQLAFAIIHSTTIGLPAWRRTCSELGLKPRLIPRDVVTRWNSTYDMMCFVLEYRKAVDQVTADKALKLRRYELDNDDWIIVGDLVSVLEVMYYFCLDRA